ncbi:MAG: excinuclease ABC subunit UvrC [Limnochordales bacterium]|nr:excinuclease ABC subunit UvrC [Limnochordales bacterium]
MGIQEKLALVPDRPGVYLMKDGEGKVIYVGKAVSLRRRVRSYFQRGRQVGTKVEHMVRQVADVEWIVTDSEAEALILESNLIKLHRPWYNVKLRDDKAYPYLKVTVNETYPRIVVVRRPRSDGARYFGPYTNSTAVRETLQFLRKLFPIRTCQLEIDKGQRRQRPCLLYHIGRCLGPCVDGLTTPDEYRQVITQICLFLEGRQEKLLAELRQRMREASSRLDFEQAARLRDVLQAIERVVERQKVLSHRLGDVDVIGLAHDRQQALACIAILFVRDGKLVGRETFLLDTAGDRAEMEEGAPDAGTQKADQNGDRGVEQEILEAFLSSYYAEAGFVPAEIWLPRPLRHDQEQMLVGWLTGRRRELLELAYATGGEKEYVPTVARSSPDYTPEEENERHRSRRGAGQKTEQVRLSVPRRGERAGLVRLAQENAWEALQEQLQAASRREAANQAAMEELARVLGLPGLPWRIECYDISNFHEREPVAAMVVAEGGEPASKEYRRFKMRTSGPNDFAMIAEVIERRFRHGLAERAELEAAGLLHTVEKRPPAWLQASTAGAAGSGAGNQGTDKVGGKSGGKAPSARFARLPDLVVIDGGPGQLGAAVQVLRNLGLGDLPVIGLAKENEWIYLPDSSEPLVLPRHSPALHLLQRVRDEAHRFGITFHRKLRGERVLASALDDVPGVGPARKKALLQAFGSVAGVRRASVEELAAVPGISRSLAEKIHEYLGRN